MELLFDLLGLILTLCLLCLGFFYGRWVERRHIRSLEDRERALSSFSLTNLKTPPPGAVVKEAFLVGGCAVIAIDHWKVFAGSVKSLFGGRIRSYETVLDRARREATLRMIDEARGRGAGAVCNLRLETSTIGGGEAGKSPGGAEVIAYGTALVLA
jgi:uncharacterized protein YbjQ (UPF0145 family)